MRFILTSIALLILCSSCGPNLKYFTEDMYDEYQWSERELKRIQFYVSQDIILYRGLSDSNSKIEDGKIKVNSDRKVEEVVIKKGTPGIFVQAPKDNRFAISFGDGKGQFLMFGPNAKANGRFVLLAKNWDRRSGQISYGGQIYETGSESAYAALMVDIKRARKTKYDSKEAKGRRVRGR